MLIKIKHKKIKSPTKDVQHPKPLVFFLQSTFSIFLHPLLGIHSSSHYHPLYSLFQMIRFLSVTQLNLSLLFTPFFLFTFYSSSDFGFHCPQVAIKKLRFLNPTSPSILFPLSFPRSIPPFLPSHFLDNFFTHLSLSLQFLLSSHSPSAQHLSRFRTSHGLLWP